MKGEKNGFIKYLKWLYMVDATDCTPVRDSKQNYETLLLKSIS